MKIKFSLLWIPFVLFGIQYPIRKILFFIFLILSIHESAHILVAKLFHYPISQLKVYPFGLCATISTLGYGSLWKEFCIVMAGPLIQLIFPFFFMKILEWGWISNAFCVYLRTINTSILMFNLLPIYPLDGGRLLQTLLHSFLRFRKAQLTTCWLSLFVLAFLFLLPCMEGVSGLFVKIFLLFQILMDFKEITQLQLKFYWYRYHNPNNLPLIVNKKNDLYRGYHNIMVQDTSWMDEQEWLSRYFFPR